MITEFEISQEKQTNLFEEFSKWSKIHYYAFKYRQIYPNLFFHYFGSNGQIEETFSKKDIQAILTTTKKYGKDVNGLWGYLSVLLENKNGICVYKMISSWVTFNHCYSVGCIQNGDLSFSNEIKEKIEYVFKSNSDYYRQVEESFEEYLLSDMGRGKSNEFKSFLNEYEGTSLFSYSKTAILNSLRNDLYYKFVEKKEGSESINMCPLSKKRKIIVDEYEENKSSNVNNKHSSAKKIPQTSTSKKQKIQKFPDVKYLSEFIDSSSSDLSSSKEETVNETIFSSPKKNGAFEPNYILYEQQSKGYISDNAKKVFTSDKKKYASDEEEFRTDKKRFKTIGKMLMFKSGKKNTPIMDKIKTFTLVNSDYKKLKRELLNRKTKRERFNLKNDKKDNIIKINNTKTAFCNNNIICNSNVNLNNCTKRKLKAVQNITNSSDEENPRNLKNNNNFDNYKEITMRKSKRTLKDDEKSSISNISAISNVSIGTRKKQVKEYSNTIKNFFTVHYDKNHPLVALNSKVENQSTKNSISNANKSYNPFLTNKKSNSILAYFPQVSNVNTKREGDILKNVAKLINNSKYLDLINLFDKDINKIYYHLISNISSKTSELMNKSNDIDIELIEQHLTSEMNFKIEEKTFDFLNNTKVSIKQLFDFYKENLTISLNQINGDDYNKDFKPVDENRFFIVMKNVKISENLIKLIIKNHNRIPDLSFSNIKSEINSIFILFISKLFNKEIIIEEDCFAEVIIERLVAFMMMLKVIHSTCTLRNDVLSISAIKDNTINFVKIVVYIVLSKLYFFNTKNMLENADQIIYISLLQILTDVYSTLNNTNEKDAHIFQLLSLVFKDYIYAGAGSTVNIDFQGSDMKVTFIETCKKLFNGNFFDAITFDKTMKSLFYKIFILQTNSISNQNELSSDSKKFLFNPILLQLYHRYYKLFLLMFCEGGKIKTENENNSLFCSLDDFYSCIISNSSQSYYDYDAIIKTIETIEVRKVINLEVKGNSLRRFLISDTTTLLVLFSKFKLKSLIKLKLLFKFLGCLGLTSKKNIIAEEEINKKNMFSLLDVIFNTEVGQKDYNEPDNMTLINVFLLNICRIIKINFLRDETDDKIRIQLLSGFLSILNDNKKIIENAKEANIYENKLGIVPIFGIVLCLVEFTNVLERNDKIELCVKKISEILDSNMTSTLLKGFNIAILLRIVCKFFKQKMNIVRYIELISQNIKCVVTKINELDQLPNLESNDTIREEHSRTIEYFLKRFIQIAKEDPCLIINNSQILEEMKNIISSDNMNKTCKRMVFIIIEILMSKFDEVVKESNKEIRNTERIVLDEGLEYNFDELFDDEMNDGDEKTLILNNQQNEFLNRLKNNFTPIMSRMILTFFSPSNSYSANVQTRHKISLELLQTICDVFPKLNSILVKYNFIKCSDFFLHFSSKSNFFSYNINNKENAEIISFIPFKAFYTFINLNSKFIEEVISKRDYKHLQHFIKLFFFAILLNFNHHSKRNNYGFNTIRSFNNENSNFIKEVFKLFNENKYLIQSNLNKIINENEGKINISELNKEESSYYNIILYIINNFETAINSFTDNNALNEFFTGLLENVSLSKNLNKIESRFLFDLLTGVEEIITRNMLFDTENSLMYSQTIKNIFLKILNKFGYDFLNYKLDQYTENFLRKFTKFALLDNFNFANNPNEVDSQLLKNKDFKAFIFTLVLNNRVDKNKDYLILYVNEYIKHIKSEITFFKENSTFSPIDIEFNLILLDFITNYAITNLNLDVYYFITFSTLEEILKLDDINIINEYFNKVIMTINTVKFQTSHRNDQILFMHTLILQRVLIYFDIEAELNKDKQFSMTFIDKVFSVCLSEIIFISQIYINRNKIELFKPKFCKLSILDKGVEIGNFNNYQPDLSIIVKYISFNKEILKILKEFYFDISDKNEDILTAQLILKEISNNLNGFETPRNNMALCEYI